MVNKPSASLQHNSQILDILVGEDNNQLITVCRDKKIKVFDIRTLAVLQEVSA